MKIEEFGEQKPFEDGEYERLDTPSRKTKKAMIREN